MQLRPRQTKFVEKCSAALKQHGNTIGVATVGFGKTIALSALAAPYPRGLILQHRIELLEQNKAKFRLVAPEGQVGTFAAGHKRWCADGHTFGMMQTVGTVKNLDMMKPVDVVVVDECHHVDAPSYRRIIERCRELNPGLHVLGVTATPERADGRGLRAVFDNVADVVTLNEMIESGFLVRPRTFIMDLEGVSAGVATLKKGKGEYDMDAAAALMDVEPVTERVVEEWFRLAADRRTIGFATNVAHSKHMTEAFKLAGVACEHVDGTTPKELRKAIWRRLKSGETQMVWNCAVATEGFDEQSISCVILNRPAMHRSTLVQMVGRGLRIIVDPDDYPGVIKDDCLVLDFGSSLLTHGTLEVDDDIDGVEAGKGEGPTKECPSCNTTIPAGCRTCPVCGHAFLTVDTEGRTRVGQFVMTEVDLMAASPYKWLDLFGGVVCVAEALTASAILVNYSGIWFAYGIIRGQRPIKLLARTHDKVVALVRADDFLRDNGDKTAARKSKRWLTEPLSDKQADLLGVPRHSGFFGFGNFAAGGGDAMNRYEACCRLTWKFAEERVRQSILAQVK